MLGISGLGCVGFNPFNYPRVSRQNRFALIKKVKNEISPYLPKVTICDRPFVNVNGVIQYSYGLDRVAIRQRRVALAKLYGLSLSEASSDNRFIIDLARKVLGTEGMPGQCAEMASISALKLKNIAAAAGLFVYTCQLPDCNHTITLLSNTLYKPYEKINWARESSSIVVDLWQGALSQDKGDALVSYAAQNGYTKSRPRAYIQCKV
ncbi:hypothetical protein [Iodobacter ciconiae]|uniref:Uncharacterized protein n=1 Tax=Iodobacter ciconiae TaxID=2496266 RepID=A0A3S8ZS02_9NEIS|nr:hypothetical protein [Iodobacter ciconiae]AZN36262.1 hypothetical protein EJO50_07050 [Iodobacter ciconiae]